MAWRVRNKQSARKATIAAQVAVVLFAGSSIAMAFMGGNILEIEDAEPAAAHPAPQPEDTAADAQQTRRFDETITAENFTFLANAPEAAPEPEEPQEAVVQTPTESGREIRYIGSIRSGERAAAFISIAGVTKLLRPGQSHEGVELVSVGEDEVVVAIDGVVEETIGKAERTGSGVTMVVGGAPAPEVTSPVVADDEAESAGRFSPDMSREERRAMLMERAREERARWQRDRDERGEGFPDRNRD